MTEVLKIVIGPQKTGSSWLHYALSKTNSGKEYRYPKRYFRNFVYNRYVKGSQVLIWPYLVHEPRCLESLIDDLTVKGVPFQLILLKRDLESLRESYQSFKVKYNGRTKAALSKADIELSEILRNIEEIKKKWPLQELKVIGANDLELSKIARVFDCSVEDLAKLRYTKVYETKETMRINSSLLTRLFFVVKPFLPIGMQEVTKLPALRKLFFKVTT